MNILYHYRTRGTGAEGVHSAFVIQGLRALGHAVSVVSPNTGEPSTTAGANPYARNAGGWRTRLLAALSRLLPQAGFELLEMFYNYPASRKIQRLLATQKFDLIYERYAFFMIAGARLARKHKIPLIVEVNEIVGPARVRQQVFVRHARRAEDAVLGQADAIIVVSSYLKEELVKRGVPAAKIEVIPNGADAELFDPAKTQPLVLRERLGLARETVVFGFIGWFVAWHRLDEFIAQFAYLKERNVVLLLIGDGPLKAQLQEQVAACGLEEKVRFIGAVPYAEIPAYISVMDVGVIPGSNEYRSPLKLFEYMLMGKAILAPRYEPIECIVTSGEEGRLFEAGNDEDLRRALVELELDAGLREREGMRGREKILKSHLWRHNAEKIEAVYFRAARK